jgi:outer membrane protein assembly factor BamE (lipoprotein component of BamABCDE complex)
MSIRPALLAAVLLSGAAACVPIRSVHGFQVVEAKPAEVVVGTDTKSTVTERLGSPSVVSTFEPNIWFYVSQNMARKAFYRAKPTTREVVAISFDESSEKVTSVEKYDLSNGKVLEYARRETPTRGRQLTILEQLLGTVGRAGNILGRNDEENQPGGRRRD